MFPSWAIRPGGHGVATQVVWKYPRASARRSSMPVRCLSRRSTMPPCSKPERESLALANGDLSTYMDIQDAADADWRQTQLGLFQPWGTPTNGPLYTIVESGTLSADRLWVDVIQFRAHQYFLQTRFYQLKDQRWQRIAPVSDLAFWGEERTVETPHFVLKFHAQDADLAAVLAQRYEVVYTRACRDLSCQGLEEIPKGRKLQITLQAADEVPNIDLQKDQLRYTLPSPRLSGLYFPTRQGERPGQDRSLIQSVVESIVYYVARESVSTFSTWPIDPTSQQFLGIIAEWESLRLTGRPNPPLLRS